MDQRLMLELMTKIAIGFNTARSHGAEHPAFNDAVSNALSTLTSIFTEHSEFRVSLSDGTFSFQDLRVERDADSALGALADHMGKRGIGGITFRSFATANDVAVLYSNLVDPDATIGGRSSEAHRPSGSAKEAITLDLLSSDAHPQKAARHKSPEEIIRAIRSLVEMVRRRGDISDARAPFIDVVNDVEHLSSRDWNSFREALASVVELLPLEKRVALLQDILIRPFSLMLLSRLESETLIESIVNWERQGKAEHIVKVLGELDKTKLKTVVPALKNRQSKIYQYLFHAGVNLLVEDMVASTVMEDDLHTVIRPYQGMLRADNVSRRHDAYKSLLNFAIRLTRDSKHGMANKVLSAIMTTIEGETEGIIAEFMNDFTELYGMSDACGQRDLCESLIESFGRILGRTELPISLRKRIIEFLSATRNPSVLPILFSLLWESGLYPDVRSAIVGFKSHAVKEAVQLLRYAEEFTLRMRLIDILKNMGGDSIEVLMENLGAREWFLRRNIVRIFGEIGESSVCSRIEHMLDDEDHRVRLEVVRAFSRLKYKAGLLHSLNDGSMQVKGEALRGLRTMIDAEEFIDMLPRLGASGDEVYVQLLKIIDEKKILEAIHWIADLLRRIEWRSDEQATEIKELSVAALARMGGNEAKVILMDLRNSQDKVLADLVSSALKRLK
ncbi:MAG: HEAT repeat domain-containing protein [candidate division WOR-3 bacterium]|nr:MAG: HEAT repeat domain-containing protein [candidate division WOR-3 bacterium]